MAFWITETDGGMAMGEAADEYEAREMIAAQQRGSVSFQENSGCYRWTAIASDGKVAHGWADTECDAWWFVREALHRPHRGTYQRAPRGLWVRPQD